MPSFLSKVFGRKKTDDSSGHGSDPSLLEGKFEAVSPNVSPTAEKFIDGSTSKDKGDKQKEQKPKEKGKDSPFSLLKSKSGTSSPDVTTPKSEPYSRLTLNLPGLKDDDNARALGVVFEADPSQLILSDAVIGSRRLTSLETLVLVRTCSQAIMARGLETLGIMHPHWHSSSPDVQRKLISLFIHSLAPKSPITTLSPTLSAPTSAFESEINSTRSPHDIAAVLRWGLRHMQLDGSSFGKDDDWYKSFFEAEKSAQYPPTAFSEQLAPKIPATHFALLTVTLDLFSSLAAHGEANSVSGSKLSKLLGLWLLTADRAQPDDDWHSFYSRWDKMGRMLEHMFLSHIRNEAVNHRMPKRLTELVQHYPYVKGSSPSPDHDLLLPRPRFSTPRFDALFVRVDSELPSGLSDNKLLSPDLLKLITNALKIDAAGTSAPYELWQKVRQALSEDEVGNEQGVLTSSASTRATENLSRILADETIRLLSFRNARQQQTAAQEFKLDAAALPVGRANGHTKSVSVDHATTTNGSAFSREKQVTSISEGTGLTNTASSSPPSSPTQVPNALGIDWTQFSRSGFLESSVGTQLAATLMDRDLEVTAPKEKRSRSLGRRSRATSPASKRKATKTDELPPLTIPTGGGGGSGEKEGKPSDSEAFINAQLPTKVTQVSFVQLDEGFIDFWSDALVDPISSNWPRFIICRFKNSVLPGLDLEGEGKKKVEWMVIEQVYSKPVLTSVSQPITGGTSDSTHETGVSSEKERRGRPSSPRPSFSSARQRLSFLSATFGSKSKTEKEKDKDKETKKKGDKGVKIGEMGEILKEEDEGEKEKDVKKEKEKRSSWALRKSADKESKEKDEKGKGEEDKKEHESKVPVAGMAAVATGVAAAAAGATMVAATEAEEKKEEKESEGEKKAEEKPAEPAVVAAPEVTEEQEQPVHAADPEISASSSAPELEPVLESVAEEPVPVPVSVPEPTPAEEVKELHPAVTAAPELPEPTPVPVVEEKPFEEEPVAAVELEATPVPVEATPVVEEVEEEKPVPVAEPEPVEAVEEEPAAAADPEPTPAPVVEEEPHVEEPVPEPESVPAEAAPVVKEEKVAEEPIAAAEPEPEVAKPIPAIAEEVGSSEPAPTESEPTTPEISIPPVSEAPEPEPTPAAPSVEEVKTENPSTDIVEESIPEPVAEPEETEPVEPIVEDTPIIVNDTVIPPDTTSSAPITESSKPEAIAQPPSEPVASFAETTVVAPPVKEKADEDAVQVPPVHVEPLREPSPGPAEDAQVSLPAVPVVEAVVPIPEPSADVPSIDLVGEAAAPPTTAEFKTEVVDSGLPPAPESVVSSGETPGPQVALSSSEPAAAAALAETGAEKAKEDEHEPGVPPGLSDAAGKLATDVAEAKEAASSEAKEAPAEEPEGHEETEPTPAS